MKRRPVILTISAALLALAVMYQSGCFDPSYEARLKRIERSYASGGCVALWRYVHPIEIENNGLNRENFRAYCQLVERTKPDVPVVSSRLVFGELAQSQGQGVYFTYDLPNGREMEIGIKAYLPRRRTYILASSLFEESLILRVAYDEASLGRALTVSRIWEYRGQMLSEQMQALESVGMRGITNLHDGRFIPWSEHAEFALAAAAQIEQQGIGWLPPEQAIGVAPDPEIEP